MSAYLPDDLALSATFIPETWATFAIIYGCSGIQIRDIEKRIRSAGQSTDHPLLFAAVFAELERERLVNTVDDLVDKFTLRSEIIENKAWDPDLNMDAPKIQEYLGLCLQ